MPRDGVPAVAVVARALHRLGLELDCRGRRGSGSGHGGEAERGGGRVVDLAGCRQALGPLERHHRTGSPRPEDAVGAAAHGDAGVDQRLLQRHDPCATFVVGGEARCRGSSCGGRSGRRRAAAGVAAGAAAVTPRHAHRRRIRAAADAEPAGPLECHQGAFGGGAEDAVGRNGEAELGQCLLDLDHHWTGRVTAEQLGRRRCRARRPAAGRGGHCDDAEGAHRRREGAAADAEPVGVLERLERTLRAGAEHAVGTAGDREAGVDQCLLHLDDDWSGRPTHRGDRSPVWPGRWTGRPPRRGRAPRRWRHRRRR